MECTSTLPGPIYTTPRLLAIRLLSTAWSNQKCLRRLKRRGAGFSDRMILIARATADANRAYNFSALLQRDAAREDHDLAVVGGVDTKELPARLRMRRQVLGRDVERPRCVGLFL